MFSSVSLLGKNEVNLINEYNNTQSIEYCSKCGIPLYQSSLAKYKEELNDLIENIARLINWIPVVTLQNPYNWEYEVLGMVTGQSTTGTGVISEFTSSFTDLFGVQASRYNNKLQVGERLCFSQLRKQALDLGANAIIATDIDYSEVGGDKECLWYVWQALRYQSPIRQRYSGKPGLKTLRNFFYSMKDKRN